MPGLQQLTIAFRLSSSFVEVNLKAMIKCQVTNGSHAQANDTFFNIVCYWLILSDPLSDRAPTLHLRLIAESS